MCSQEKYHPINIQFLYQLLFAYEVKAQNRYIRSQNRYIFSSDSYIHIRKRYVSNIKPNEET